LWVAAGAENVHEANKSETIELINMTKKELTYQQAIAEVEKILELLEGSTENVDAMSAAVKRATELLQLCHKKLRDTEEELEKQLKAEN
jgi:exodeoxyribonuclease VII small subunit